MTYILTNDDIIRIQRNLRNFYNSLNYNNFTNNIFNFFYFFAECIILLYEFLYKIYINTKKKFILICLKDSIYQIDYINIDNNNICSLYKLNIFYRLYLYLFTSSVFIKFYINEKTKLDIKKLINFHDNGFLKIKYYNDKESKNILINLNKFKNKNFLFKHTDILIVNIIYNLLENYVTNGNDIIYCEIKNNDTKIDITKFFKKYKNSFKDDNIKLYQLLLILNIIDNINLYQDNIQNYKLVITDKSLDEKTYYLQDSINLKTFYEFLADKETSNIN